MDRRIKRNAPDNVAADMCDKDDETARAITKEVLAEFLTALTSATTTAFATAVSAVRPVSTPRYSTEIDPLNTKSMDLTLRDGIVQGYKATKKTDGCK